MLVAEFVDLFVRYDLAKRWVNNLAKQIAIRIVAVASIVGHESQGEG